MAAQFAFFWFFDVPADAVGDVRIALLLIGLNLALIFPFSVFEGMTLGLIVYIVTGRRLAHVGNPPPDGARPWGKLGFVVLGTAALMWVMTLSDRYPVIIYGLLAVQIAAILFFAFRPDRDSKRIAFVSNSGPIVR